MSGMQSMGKLCTEHERCARVYVDPVWRIVDVVAYDRAWGMLCDDASMWGIIGLDMEWSPESIANLASYQHSKRSVCQPPESATRSGVISSDLFFKSKKGNIIKRSFVSVVQISSARVTLVVRFYDLVCLVHRIPCEDALSGCLTKNRSWPCHHRVGERGNSYATLLRIYNNMVGLLGNDQVIKVGVGVQADAKKIQSDYPLLHCVSCLDLATIMHHFLHNTGRAQEKEQGGTSDAANAVVASLETPQGTGGLSVGGSETEKNASDALPKQCGVEDRCCCADGCDRAEAVKAAGTQTRDTLGWMSAPSTTAQHNSVTSTDTDLNLHGIRSLKDMCRVFAHRSLDKDMFVTTSAWGSSLGALSAMQLNYAAADAEASFDACIGILAMAQTYRNTNNATTDGGGHKHDHLCRMCQVARYMRAGQADVKQDEEDGDVEKTSVCSPAGTLSHAAGHGSGGSDGVMIDSKHSIGTSILLPLVHSGAPRSNAQKANKQATKCQSQVNRSRHGRQNNSACWRDRVGGGSYGKYGNVLCPGRSRRYYDNIEVLDPSGKLVFTVDKNKADWYVNRKKLAHVVTWRDGSPSVPQPMNDPNDGVNSAPGRQARTDSQDDNSVSSVDANQQVTATDDQLDTLHITGREMAVIQLSFTPLDRTKHNDAHVPRSSQYFKSKKENCCVVCSSEKELVRFAVVPHLYRKYFPAVYMSHNSYDLLLLCVPCFTHARTVYDTERQSIAHKFGIPLEPINLHACAVMKRDMERLRGKALCDSDSVTHVTVRDELAIDPLVQLEVMSEHCEIQTHRQCILTIVNYAKALRAHYTDLEQQQQKRLQHEVECCESAFDKDDGKSECQVPATSDGTNGQYAKTSTTVCSATEGKTTWPDKTIPIGTTSHDTGTTSSVISAEHARPHRRGERCKSTAWLPTVIPEKRVHALRHYIDTHAPKYPFYDLSRASSLACSPSQPTHDAATQTHIFTHYGASSVQGLDFILRGCNGASRFRDILARFWLTQHSPKTMLTDVVQRESEPRKCGVDNVGTMRYKEGDDGNEIVEAEDEACKKRNIGFTNITASVHDKHNLRDRDDNMHTSRTPTGSSMPGGQASCNADATGHEFVAMSQTRLDKAKSNTGASQERQLGRREVASGVTGADARQQNNTKKMTRTGRCSLAKGLVGEEDGSQSGGTDATNKCHPYVDSHGFSVVQMLTRSYLAQCDESNVNNIANRAELHSLPEERCATGHVSASTRGEGRSTAPPASLTIAAERAIGRFIYHWRCLFLREMQPLFLPNGWCAEDGILL